MLQALLPSFIYYHMRFSRLLPILALFALLFAPAAMLGNHAAMAMPHDAAAPMMSHCDDRKQTPADSEDRAAIDCAIACSAMPCADPFVAPKPMAVTPQFKAGVFRFSVGTRPEAATPPPRPL